ncbi:hypothetical protein, partial [uncultured Chryseobacterium sp.]|uniref:hypothetical protein n=1 Tax=uncultured Chryseobacterium sp. TaxID=259322 RepID=UPI0025F75679
IYFSLLLVAIAIQSCSFLEQKNFSETKIISGNPDENIVYKYHQTRAGLYKVDFYSVHEGDSVKLFEHHAHSSFLTSNRYTISETPEGIVISTGLFSNERKITTPNGKSITLTHR